MQSSKVIAPGDHEVFMNYALEIALSSPSDPTNTHRIAALLTNATTGQILSTGYSHEFPGDLSPSDMGSTHAEQVCFMKIAQKHDLPIAQAELHIEAFLPEEGCVLYTTMEPCSRRSKEGWRSCCERILALKGKVKCVVVGMGHAGIEGNEAERVLREGGVGFVRMGEEMGRRCEEVAGSS
ncbi:hypothetical protein CB0940_02541 [Cercospora beticola]|uniref:CMP/dCMP-type deaminase domain-containing protein n=1 Tax=Cercospora beticola TaxID=122368 RepID=A0A2G5I398_CERBT|nr:hypothetical protein CB0940_02541 [Cercospora beticola]PIA99269.1 hypothetical protein CB0940_02541 [Cercospora beticola]